MSAADTDAQAAAHAAEQRFMEFDLDKDPRFQRFVAQSGAKTPEELEMAAREWYRADVDPDLPVEPSDHDVFRPSAMRRSEHVGCAVIHIMARRRRQLNSSRSSATNARVLYPQVVPSLDRGVCDRAWINVAVEREQGLAIHRYG